MKVSRKPARRPPRTLSGRERVVIEGIAPLVDCGRYPIKRTVGETVAVEVAAECKIDGKGGEDVGRSVEEPREQARDHEAKGVTIHVPAT